MDTLRHRIDLQDIEGLQAYVAELCASPPTEFALPWEYIYKDAYLYACGHRRRLIAEWIESIFEELFTDPVSRIGLRQTFVYGRYILRRAEERVPDPAATE